MNDYIWRISERDVVCPRCVQVLGDLRDFRREPGTVTCIGCGLSNPAGWFVGQQHLRAVWNPFLAVHSRRPPGITRYTWAQQRLSLLIPVRDALAAEGLKLQPFWDEQIDDLRAWLPELEEEHWERTARAAVTAGQLAAAVEAYHTLHQLRPLSAKELRTVGELLLERGEKRQAVQAWRRALTLDSKVGVARKLFTLEAEVGE